MKRTKRFWSCEKHKDGYNIKLEFLTENGRYFTKTVHISQVQINKSFDPVGLMCHYMSVVHSQLLSEVFPLRTFGFRVWRD